MKKSTKGINQPMLLHAEKIGKDVVMFRRLDSKHYADAIQSEVHQLIGRRYVRYQESSDDEKTTEIGKMNYKNADPAVAEARLKMISTKLRPVEDIARGAPAGFCFQGVIFDIGQSDETAMFDFKSKSVPDLGFSINYHAVTGQPKEGLVARGDKYKLPTELDSMVSTMRRGTRLLGGMNAEELLDKTTRPVVQHVFDIETRTSKQNFAHPQISISMITGQGVSVDGKRVKPEGESTISDDQALKLWDGIIDSIRIRPGALPMGMTSLGDITPTCRFGDVCPRSDYWMKQVNHPQFRLNAYYAAAPVHQPYK